MPSNAPTKKNAPLIRAHDSPPAAPAALVVGVRLEDESRGRELALHAAHQACDVTDTTAHAVALVARPVRQREIQHTAAA